MEPRRPYRVEVALGVLSRSQQGEIYDEMFRVRRLYWRKRIEVCIQSVAGRLVRRALQHIRGQLMARGY